MVAHILSLNIHVSLSPLNQSNSIAGRLQKNWQQKLVGRNLFWFQRECHAKLSARRRNFIIARTKIFRLRTTVDRWLRRNQILMVLPTRQAADCVPGRLSVDLSTPSGTGRVTDARTTHLLKTSAIDKSQCCVFCSSKQRWAGMSCSIHIPSHSHCFFHSLKLPFPYSHSNISSDNKWPVNSTIYWARERTSVFFSYIVPSNYYFVETK